MISVDDFFEEVRECDYKGEHYSVRDNGAVMRHPRSGRRVTKYDNVWTFGKTNSNRYNFIASVQVHRIVATAFHGEPPTAQHIVDHIDTNRQNNRPENLRWVTKLENILNNEITRAKIIFLCGSVEAFLKNPEILRGYESLDTNFSWMRAVSPEEAKISRERLTQWAKNPPVSNGGLTGERIFEATRLKHNRAPRGIKRAKLASPQNPVSAEDIIKMSQSERIPELDDKIELSHEYPSLTPNVVQVNWKTPTEFPLCPQMQVDNPIVEYQNRLTPESVFCHNEYADSLTVDSALTDNSSTLLVLCKSSDDGTLKPWSLAKITHRNGKYYHESIQTYFHEDGAQKYFTLAQGKEWTGGEVFDDLV